MYEHEKSRYREALLDGVRHEAHEELRALMRSIVEAHAEEAGGGRQISTLFAEVFDAVYSDLLSKKIDLKRKTRHMIEMLSMPNYRKPPEEERRTYEAILS